MSRSGGHRAVAVALGFMLSLLAGTQVRAETPRDYAYMLLQGKLSEAKTGLPLAATSIRLTSETESFERLTDARGVFNFERLPVSNYELRVTTPDGRVIRAVQQGTPFEPGGARFKLWVRKTGGASIRIEARAEQVAIIAPERTQWPKLWKELAVFAVLGGALAL